MENENKPSRLAWIGRSFVGVKDQFAEWFVGSTAIFFLMASVLTATIVVFFMDGLWARNQAPEGLEALFMAGGIGVRLWTVAALTLSVMLWSKGAKWFAVGVALTWCFTSLLSYGHVLGFFAQGQMERYASGAAVENKTGLTETSVEDKLALIDSQRAGVRRDRDSDVAAYETTLDSLINDGDARNDAEATETYTALIGTVRTNARAKLDALDAQELEIVSAGAETKLDINDEEIGATKFDALYVWVAGWMGRTQDTTNAEAGLRQTAQQGASLLALAIEMLSGLGHAILYAATLVLRGGQGKPIYTEEEMMAKARKVAGGLKAADTAREARNRGPKKISQAGTKSDVHNAEYWNDAVEKMIGFRRDKMPKAAFSFLVEKYGAGRTGPEFSAGLRDAVKREWVEQEQYDTLMQVPAVMNGAAQDEDFIPPTTGAEDADDASSSQPN